MKVKFLGVNFTPPFGPIISGSESLKNSVSGSESGIRIHRIHMFWASGSSGFSGSTSQRYGARSFYHQAKIVRKTMILPVRYCFVTSFGLFIFEKLCQCAFKK